MLRLFKSKFFLVLLATLLLLIIIGISAKSDSRLAYFDDAVSVPLTPVQGFFSFIGNKVEGSFNFFRDIKKVRQENEALKVKVDDLENKVRTLQRYEEENKRLREAVNLKNQFNDYEPVGGNIIAKDMGNWFNTFTIDIGRNDSITEESPVITSKGLVGRVIETMPLSSKVLSIIDIDSSVSAIITKSQKMVMVTGDIKLKEQGLCRMDYDYISNEFDLNPGDIVETSGMGGVFPRGILIGKVKEIRQETGGLKKYAVIEPAVDFKKIQEVFVLKSKANTTKAGNVEK